MKKKVLYFFALGLLSCDNEPQRQAMIQAAIQAKIIDFSQKKIEACEQSAYTAATEITDSILLQNAELWQLSTDSLPRPARVTKPKNGKNAAKTVVDSTPVQPLFPLK